MDSPIPGRTLVEVPLAGATALAGRDSFRWRALLALMAGMFVVASGYGVMLPMIPFLIERFASTAEISWHTGLLTATYTLALFLFAPMWGRLSDRLQPRTILLLGLTGFGAAFALSAFVDSVPVLYLARFITGVFASAITPVTYALAGAQSKDKERRAHHFALLNLAGTAGFIVGPMIGGLGLVAARGIFSGEQSLRMALPILVVSALALLIGLVGSAVVPSEPGQVSHSSGEGTPKASRSGAMLRRLLFISFVAAFAIGAFEVGLALRGKQILDYSADQIGIMFTECSLVMFVAQSVVFSPFIKPDLTRWLMAPSLALLAAGLAAVPYMRDYLLVTFAVGFIAAAVGVLSPIATYWISLGAQDRQGTELGWQTAAASLGSTLGATGGGLLFGLSVIPNAPFMLAAVLVVAALLASLSLPRMLGTISAREPSSPR